MADGATFIRFSGIYSISQLFVYKYIIAYSYVFLCDAFNEMILLRYIMMDGLGEDPCQCIYGILDINS